MNPNYRPLSRSPNRQARRRDNLDPSIIEMGPIIAGLGSQNELNQGALDALDPRMDSNNARLASQNELNRSRDALLSRSPGLYGSEVEVEVEVEVEIEVEASTGEARTIDGSGTSYFLSGQASEAEFRTQARLRDAVLTRRGVRILPASAEEASQAEFRTREAPARTRDVQLSRSPGSHRNRREARIIPASTREARIIPASQTGLSQRQARVRSLMPSLSEIQSAREAEFRTREAPARTRDILLSRSPQGREDRIIPASTGEARIVPDSAREARTIPARVSNPWPRLSEIQSGVPLRRPSHFRRLLSHAMETREREAPRTEAHRRDTRTFHISIPNSELASQNETMNLTSQQAGPAGHFRVSVPRVREAFRRDTNASDVDQFNAILTQLADSAEQAERDLQNV